MNLLSDQGWSSGESTRLPPMWPGFNATVFVSQPFLSRNAPPQQTAKGGALRDETKTVARETNWLQNSLLARSPCMGSRADKGWAVKRARPSKKVWCSGLGLCLEIKCRLFFFGQGLRCGLSVRHCRCHWIMEAWFVFLHFFLVP